VHNEMLSCCSDSFSGRYFNRWYLQGTIKLFLIHLIALKIIFFLENMLNQNKKAVINPALIKPK
jgi:hypothetical protein